MSEWYLYQPDGVASGPWSTEALAEAILAGRLPADCWVARPGGNEWVKALAVPVIAQRVEGVPTRPRPPTSGLRPLTEAPATTARPGSDTLQMRVPPAMSVRFPEDDEEEQVPPSPSTQRGLPPPSTPTPPTGRVKAAS